MESFLFYSQPILWSQECKQIWLEGKLSDTTFYEVKFIFDVVNISQDTILRNLPYGMYEGYVKPKNSIQIKSLDYKDTIFVIPKTNNCKLEIENILDPKFQIYDDVNIYNVKNLSDLKNQRFNIKKETYDRSTVSGPISSIYSALSKKEQNKRKLIEIKYEEEKQEIIKNSLFICLNENYITLPHEEVQPFLLSLVFSDHFF